MWKTCVLGAALSALLVAGAQAQGRQLTRIANVSGTEFVPEFGVTFGVRPIVGIQWDPRCSSVEYVFNSAGAANPGTADEIAPQVLADTVQGSMNRWNDNPASYISMNITDVRNLGDRPRIPFDFVNEVTFITPEGFTALASSPSVALIVDTTFNPGDDINGDGNSDVFDPAVEGRNTCFDADGDGDIEFPAGDYAAGTILDNDVQFSTTAAWELTASDPNAADVAAVATHELGHSHGLNHALTNQISPTDGTGSTMYPFVDTGSSGDELGVRSLHSDDLAASAFLYPEGTGEGIAALQSGDVAFDKAYDLIRGSVFNATFNSPVIGAAVYAEDRHGNRVSQTYSGELVAYADVLGVTDTPGQSFAVPAGIRNGDFVLPVPKSQTYRLKIEAVDGQPVAANRVNNVTAIAEIFGLTQFPEEGFARNSESDIEFQPDLSPVFWSRGTVSQNVNFITNVETALSNAGPPDVDGIGELAFAESVTYIERFDRDDILPRIAAGDRPISGLFLTTSFNAAEVSQLTEAKVMTGRELPNGSVELLKTLSSDPHFVGQADEFTPFVIQNPWGLPFDIRRELGNDETLDLFLVLSGDNLTLSEGLPFPPALVGLDTDAPGGTSYVSLNDGPILPINSAAWAVELRFINDGEPVSPWLASVID